MRKKILEIISGAIKSCIDKGLLGIAEVPELELEMTRDPSFGDYASNAAMVLASKARMKPRRIAEDIVANISDPQGMIEKIDIAGPGFINIFIKPEFWAASLQEIDEARENFGKSQIGGGRKVQVEFVSANPTGPLHIGHARGAVTGDVIASILKAAGYSVFREYYVNNVGKQMNTLGMSVFLRCRELLGEKVEFPAEYYQGEYIAGLARELLEKHGKGLLDNPDYLGICREYASESIMDGIKEDLAALGVSFDDYFPESELYKNDGLQKVLRELQEKDFIYSDGKTLWFRTTKYGDEKDRVVVRENGEPTYFASDLSYHKKKYERGFEQIIDIWGADHHGYIPRMHAGVQAFGYKKETLRIVLVQLVNLLREGAPVAMSTRSGEFVTLREVVDEVGKDAARYNFLMRRSDSHLDFDLELAKKQSNENPVYYVQYAHARICSIMRTAAERDFAVPAFGEADLGRLTLPEEVALIKLLTRYPEIVEGSARSLEPHRFTFYLGELASVFHSYYNKHRVISEDVQLSRARLFLAKSIGTVLKNALNLLGVSAPEKM
jgi:arginyl-tRNA synthetase